MAAPKGITIAKFETALRKPGGNQSAAAAMLGISRPVVCYRVGKSARLQAAIAEVKEEVIDLAESQLTKAIGAGNLTAIIFYLKTQAKHRGYVERQEQTGAGGGPVKMQEVPLDAAARDARVIALFDRARKRRAAQVVPGGES